MIFYDNLTGEASDFEGVIKARADEMEELRKHGVYRKLPIKECYDKLGKHQVG